MRSLWGKSSSKKKASKENIICTLHKKSKNTSEGKQGSRSGGSQRHCNDNISELGSQSRAESRSTSPSKQVSRCQSFAERTNAQPLPLPGPHPAAVGRTDSGISVSTKPRLGKGSKKSLFLPLRKPACIRGRANATDLDGDLVTTSFSSEGSTDSDDPADSHHRSPLTNDYDNGTRTAFSSPSCVVVPKDHPSSAAQTNSRDAKRTLNLSLGNRISPKSAKQRPLSGAVPNLQVSFHNAFSSAPDSSRSSPSRSPINVLGTEQVVNSTFWAGKPYADVTLHGSGHCSPSSGQTSGHNSMGGDMSGQLFWQQSRGSPEYSPIPSPRMASPGPSSRIQSGAVTPRHPRAGGAPIESQTSWPDDGKQQSHRLPLPPIMVSNSSPFSHSNSATTSPQVPRSPGRVENSVNLESHWKKGKLLGRGTFGHVYVGFNSDSGEMCAMKEVTLFDDAKSRESAKQLMQEIALLSRLRHPNIVQYYGSKTVGEKLYIYLEYVSGGSIYKLLQDYGQFGELAMRSYTQQILSGLAYLHSKHTVHRDIKGANILVDPNGRVKLADFGMAKHIAGQSCTLSFKGSPYWMAPEVIKNPNGCNLAVDIWSLGCTVLEMATTKPPWSQYEGVAAMFKIGNSKELPAIPDHLSNEGKDFVRQCLQRNPAFRPTAAELLEHPFVKSAAPLERPILDLEHSDIPPGVTNGVKNLGIGQSRIYSPLDSEKLAVHSSRVLTSPHASDILIPKNKSCPVSPIGSPHLHPRSPQHLNGRLSPSPISSPRTTSGSSTPLTGGSVAIPFNHLKQPVYLQESFGSMPKPSNSFYSNGPYQDSNPNIFRGMQPGSHIFSDLLPSESDVLGKQLGRPVHGEPYDGQSVLADRVSRQLLKDHVKMNPSLDLSPSSPSPTRTSGV
ncbi:mitogen-activated protein kinase kinase kinase YODA-like [Mangifera indica]|uniref:mitogen-activated protein kinase kinase kinase YODA-like n=1 Tax=Mangifera indica TaxID=29780 RepID=UPI001CF99F5C|nr:mitogen-activated protein kinase kinase kinase YODA-like [Mangifera indica]XP_044506017.1 mitogen-activated protein kinase kinase kinase YODA-like [Mangifera indica]